MWIKGKVPSMGSDGASLTTPTIIKGATSPAALATAKISPVIIAGVAIGNTVLINVSAFVAPKARLPLSQIPRYSSQTSSVETITTGTVNIAKVKEDQIKPGVPNLGAGATSG